MGDGDWLGANHNFDYTPPENYSYYVSPENAHYDSPEFDKAIKGDQPEPFDADSTDITVHYPRVSAEEPQSIYEAAVAWGGIHDVLDTLASDVVTNGKHLQTSWESPDAENVFFDFVGKSTYSLREWQQVAGTNNDALWTLYSAVWDAKNAMTREGGLWDQFEADYRQAHADQEVLESNTASVNHATGTATPTAAMDEVADRRGLSTNPTGLYSYMNTDGRDLVGQNLDHYTKRSRDEILTPLSTAYDKAFMAMATASKFRGPTNAVAPGAALAAAQSRMASQMPGPPGSMPGAPPAAPGATTGAPPKAPPVAPNLAQAEMMRPNGAPQALPDGLTAGQRPEGLPESLNQSAVAPVAPNIAGTAPANRTSSGPAPAAPNLSQANQTAPVAPNLSGTAAGTTDPAGMPNALAGRGVPPVAPNVGTPSSPGVPGGARPMAPGGMGRGGPPGARPSSPSLNGRNGTSAPSRPGGPAPSLPGRGGGARLAGPGNGRGAPPSLPGRNGQGKPGAPTTNRPGTPGPGAPGAGRPGTASRGGVPKSLAGRADKIAKPTMKTQIKPTPTEGLGGRAAPRMSRAETLKSARAALRRNLGGRPADPADLNSTRGTEPSKEEKRKLDQRRRDEEAAAPYGGIVGDHELFDIDKVLPGVLERAQESGPVKRSGPALGVGRVG